MDYKNVVLGIMVAFVIGFSFFTWIDGLNAAYVPLGGQAIDTGFYSDVQPIYGQAQNLSDNSAGSTSGSSVSSSTGSTLLGQSRSTFGIVQDFFSFIPNLIRNAAVRFHVPGEIAAIAGWAFTFTFIITLALLIFMGVRYAVT